VDKYAKIIKEHPAEAAEMLACELRQKDRIISEVCTTLRWIESRDKDFEARGHIHDAISLCSVRGVRACPGKNEAARTPET